ncbi:hypothetical protein SAMN05443634_11448 [Chishuiella changwenlii]|uniref:Signal peptidase n=1 Tax=Chishuiella changwenlii TaxID=1434701 RepID=A0A1M7CMA8_9FLAO|nr:hypothetical protein [Chishuiella changwenlii]GGF09479.1 hypothetical protein GCM10010984_28280 [Chishuiella changwenlii]SHL68414.1 hypothetical protein SAMN05443634_11448 [Chishuiella changwenlii]
MKNFKFLFTFILLTILNVSISAQDCLPGDPDCGTPPPPVTGAPGTPATPIDDYIPMLVVTAIIVGGAISYKQKELFRK